MERTGFTQTVSSVPLREQPDGKNQLNSRYEKRSTVEDYNAPRVMIDFIVANTMHPVSKILFLELLACMRQMYITG